MLAIQARFAVFTWLANFMAHLPVWVNPSHLHTSLPLSLPTPSLYLSLRDGLGVWYTFVLGGIRTQGSRDVGMTCCQACRCIPPSSLVLLMGRGVLAPPACGQGCRLTALPMDGNSRADWCSCPTIAVLCMAVSSGWRRQDSQLDCPRYL